MRYEDIKYMPYSDFKEQIAKEIKQQQPQAFGVKFGSPMGQLHHPTTKKESFSFSFSRI